MDQWENGRILYKAVSEREPMGKLLAECERVSVFLRLYSPEDGQKVETSLAELRCQRIRRLTYDAIEQGGVLTMEDLALLLTSSLSTIVRDVRKLRKEGVTIPTRGQLKDIGCCIDHRLQIIRMYLAGNSPEKIAEVTCRSLDDVHRPIEKYEDVRNLIEKRMPMEKIIQVTKISPRIFQEFQKLSEENPM